MQPLVLLTVFFGMELDLINRRDRGAWVWSEKHLHQLAYYPTTPYWDTERTAVKKMAKAMAALKVAKIVVKGTEPEARLLYRLMSNVGMARGASYRGVASATSGGVGLYKTRSAEGGD